VLEALFILLEFSSPSRRIFIGSLSLPPLSSSPYRSFKFDKDESLDGVILPVKIIGKEDIGLFFFPQNPETTSTLVHQLMHLSCITRLLLVVGPPGFTKRG
jgi:hypothetical protein